MAYVQLTDAQLQEIAAGGLSLATRMHIAEYVQATTAGDANKAFIDAAQDQTREGELEVDDSAIVSASDDGAYVMAWLWVENADAGIKTERPLDADGWDQEFPIEDWRYEVADGDTKLGYDNWLAVKLEDAV